MMKIFPYALSIAALAAFPLAAQGFDPPVAPDINPDPTIVEVNLTAGVTTWQYLPGIDTTVWAYNDSIPGPTIRASVGQTLVVNFTNNLPDPTTVHWHGVEITAAMDGSHISQLTVPPGGTFRYEFPLISDGMFWYHPHVRPFDQVEKGLYGVLIVDDPVKEAQVFANLEGRTVEEHIVVFDDVLLDMQGQVVPAFSFTDPSQNALYYLNGRVGNVLLVNGKPADQVTLPVPNGEIQRWRCLNAANTTICRLDINDPVTGIGTSLWDIGADGGFNNKEFLRFPVTSTAPSAEHPGQALLSQMGEGILLFPAERLDMVFTPSGTPGAKFTVQQKDWFRGRHTASQPGGIGTPIILGEDSNDGNYEDQPYFSMQLVDPNPGTGEWVPSFSMPFADPGPEVGTKVFMLGHGNPDPFTGAITLFAQADMSSGTMVPLPTPKIDSFNAHDIDVGDVWVFEVHNLTHGEHPFHIHGFFFELIEWEFQDMDDPSLNFVFRPWVTGRLGRVSKKDTIRCPPRLGAKGRSRTITRLRVHFDDTNREGEVVAQGQLPTFDRQGNWTSGGWLAHCHILEHSGTGMLTFFEVHDPDDPVVLLGKHLGGTLGNASLTVHSGMMGGRSWIDLVDALPQTNVILLLGDTAARTPFLGGEIVPGGQLIAVVGLTNGMGRHSWPFPWRVLPTGAELYLQAGFADTGAPMGLALSNAMKWITP